MTNVEFTGVHRVKFTLGAKVSIGKVDEEVSDSTYRSHSLCGFGYVLTWRTWTIPDPKLVERRRCLRYLDAALDEAHKSEEDVPNFIRALNAIKKAIENPIKE